MAIHVLKGDGPPVVIPTQFGEHYVDETNKKHYLSVGITDVNDWVLTGDAVENFIQLIDTPSTYVGAANKVIKVLPTEDGVEFVSEGATPIPQNQTVYVDAVHGSDTPSGNLGQIGAPYKTIKAALDYIR